MEVAAILREAYKRDYPLYSHQQAKIASKGLTREFFKPLLKGFWALWKRHATAEEAEKELNATLDTMKESKEALDRMLAEKGENITFREMATVPFSFITQNARIKAVTYYAFVSVSTIAKICAKNGMKGEEDRLWSISAGNLAKRMNDAVTTLGHLLREMHAENKVAVRVECGVESVGAGGQGGRGCGERVGRFSATRRVTSCCGVREGVGRVHGLLRLSLPLRTRRWDPPVLTPRRPHM